MALLKPGPEVGKLGYFVGAWFTSGTIAEGPWGKGGEFNWSETTKWMTGRFFLVGHWDYEMPASLGGSGEEMFVMGYDMNRQLYTFDAFSSHGQHQVSRGTLDGDTWIWLSQTVDGSTKQKMITKIITPSLTF